MFKKYTILTLILLFVSQGFGMSWLNRTFRPEYRDLSDTLQRCPVGEKKCLDYFAKYKKEINDNYKDYSQYNGLGTHFAQATNNRSLPEIEHLVTLGADVNKKPENSSNAVTPLWAVVRRFLSNELGTVRENSTNAPEMIKFLVSKGANINERNKHGYTPLRMSLDFTGLKMTEWLIENGANVNQEYYGKSLLMVARLDQAELLIKAGADVNHVATYGKTPLFDAVEHGQVKKAALLVKHGADIHALYSSRWREESTPLSEAIDNKDLSMLRALGVVRKPSQMTEFTGPNFIDN